MIKKNKNTSNEILKVEKLIFEAERSVKMKKFISPSIQRIVEASNSIQQEKPERLEFLHSVFCQVGLPRRQIAERSFERRSGNSSLFLQAGKLWQGEKEQWVDQPLPYGAKPRLIMVYLSGEALRTQSRRIEIGDSIRSFLKTLGLGSDGRTYAMFRKQMEALAACQMTLGLSLDGRNLTINTQAISRFEAWGNTENPNQKPWPGVLEISQEFFDSLNNHAVPLDHRAIAAIKHSSMSIDIYTWLAHRLHRIHKTQGVFLSWENLKGQFGQEYICIKDFQKEFREALRQVMAVYPDARIESDYVGLILKPSKPPVRKIQVAVGNNLLVNKPCI